MKLPARRFFGLTAVAGLWLAAAFSFAQAQTIACTGPTGGNCVPVVQMQTVAGAAGYPTSAVPITGSALGTTAQTSGSLAAVAAKTTYICGYYVSINATAAITGAGSITGVITGSMSFQQSVAVTPAVSVSQQTFTPCIPASAVNTVININSIAAGAGGAVSVYAWGFQL